MNRRDFCYGLGIGIPLLCGLPIEALLASDRKTYIVAAHTDRPFGDYENADIRFAADIPGYIVTYDLNKRVKRMVELPNFVHVFNQHPIQTELLVGASKWTSSAVAYNVLEEKLVAQIKAPEGYRFFGHGFFSRDGRYVYLSSSNLQNQGAFCQFDCNTWKLNQMLESGGNMPHDCLLNEHDEVCAALSTGHVSFLTADTFKTIRTFGVEGAGHICPMGGDRYVIGGVHAPEPTLHLLDKAKGSVQDFRSAANYRPHYLKGEALSLCALSENVVACSITKSSEMVLWNIQTNQLHTVPSKENFIGLLKTANTLYATTGRAGKLERFDATKIDKVAADFPPLPFGNGRHIRLVQI